MQTTLKALQALPNLSTLAALLCLAPLAAQTPFNYVATNGTITITKYTGHSSDVDIPETIDRLPVTTIGDHAFSGCFSLTNLLIPDSVTSIGKLTFFLCRNLTSITIPDSVTSIGEAAFFLCPSLTRVTIGNSVTTIGNKAFAECPRLTNVTIPAAVTSIGNTPFRNCSSLRAIAVNALNSSYSSADGVLFDRSTNTLIQCPGGKVGSYAIPNTVTTIGHGAFQFCGSLTRITIPDSVTNIAAEAFQACTNLTEVCFLGDAPRLDSTAFADAKNAKVYYLPRTTGWGTTLGGLPTALWEPKSSRPPAEGDAANLVPEERAETNLNSQLLAAISAGKTTHVSRILDQGADPNAVDEKGLSALIASAVYDDIYAARLLLDKGATVNYAEPKQGLTALMQAAAVAGDDFVALLLQRGAKADAASLTGSNALIEALATRRFKSAELLLMQGANPNYVVNGLPIISGCVLWEADEFAFRLLKKYGARADLRATSGDYAGKTALEIAKQLKRANIVPLLKAKATGPIDCVNMPQALAFRNSGPKVAVTGRIQKIEAHRILFEPITGDKSSGDVILMRFDENTVLKKRSGAKFMRTTNIAEFSKYPIVTATLPLFGSRLLIELSEGPMLIGESGILE